MLSLLALVGCQQEAYVHTEQYVSADGGPEELMGVECMSLDKGNGFGGGRAPNVPGAGGEGAGTGQDYSFSYEATGSLMRLVVQDPQGATLAERSYDRAFVDSGRKDELKVDTGGGSSARFIAWGVPDCNAGN